jgi:hypothetical protein
MPTPEGQVLLRRWQALEEAKTNDLRATSPAAALMQLDSMYASVDVLGLRESLGEGEEELREKWARLRRRYGIKR